MKTLIVICLVVIVVGFAIGAFVVNSEEKKYGRRK